MLEIIIFACKSIASATACNNLIIQTFVVTTRTESTVLLLLAGILEAEEATTARVVLHRLGERLVSANLHVSD